MTIENYISQRFSSVGLKPTEADLIDLNIEDLQAEVNSENQVELYAIFISKIPQMLLRPASVSEGGVSVSRANKTDIEAFYSSECKRLGLKNELVKPKVRFR